MNFESWANHSVVCGRIGYHSNMPSLFHSQTKTVLNRKEGGRKIYALLLYNLLIAVYVEIVGYLDKDIFLWVELVVYK